MIFRMLVRRRENKWKPKVDFLVHLGYHLLLSMIELSMSVKYAMYIGTYLLEGKRFARRRFTTARYRLVASLQVRGSSFLGCHQVF